MTITSDTPTPQLRLIHPMKEATAHLPPQAIAPAAEVTVSDCTLMRIVRHDYPVWVYKIPPIDFWYGWSRVCDVVAKADFDPEHDADFAFNTIDAGQWAYQWLAAQAGARRLGWEEGDIRGYPDYGPLVSGLPEWDGGGEGCFFMIAWKQLDHGTTFVASPMPLPWLIRDGCGRCTVINAKDDVPRPKRPARQRQRQRRRHSKSTQ
jgi:hypothetical protein